MNKTVGSIGNRGKRCILLWFRPPVLQASPFDTQHYSCMSLSRSSQAAVQCILFVMGLMKYILK